MNVSEKKMLRLQENLPLIRNLAGWTAEDLGKNIGVTRQTITNIEKSNTLSMTKTQYIAIRAVLDYEISNNHNKTLSDAIAVLVDADDLTKDQEMKIHKTISYIAETKPRRMRDKIVLESVATMIATLGIIGSLTMSQSLNKPSSIPKWLSDLMK